MIVRWINRIGVFGLFIFALFSLLKTAPPHLGLALALPAALLGLWQHRHFPWSARAWLTLAVLVWLCLRYALQPLAHLVEPGLYGQKEVFIDWLAVLVYALLAALPTASPLARLRHLWLLAGLGFVAGIASFLAREGVAVLWSGARLGFHLDRALGIGLYAGCLLILLVATAHLWWPLRGAWRWPVRIGAMVTMLLLAQVLITTQNRSNFLGMGAVIALASLLFIAHLIRHRRERNARVLLGAGVVVLTLVVGFATTNINSITQRFEAEASGFRVAMAQGIDEAPYSSINVRLLMWRYVLQRAPEAPLLGHGFGDLRDVIDRDLRSTGKLGELERYDHVHSTYFQTLWTQGAIGLLLWGALAIVLIRDAVRAGRSDPKVRALMPALWGVLVYTAVWGAFDYRLSHPDMRFFSILLLLSLTLMGQAAQRPRDYA